MAKRNAGLVFPDGRLRDGYRDLLSVRRSMRSKVRVIVTSPDPDWNEYLEALRLGAFDVIAAPCCPVDIARMVIQARRDKRNRLARTASFNGTA